MMTISDVHGGRPPDGHEWRGRHDPSTPAAYTCHRRLADATPDPTDPQERTAQQVRYAATRLGYLPSAAAWSLRHGRSWCSRG
jgi:DNA-binding LacI/PurR family transcriptional regulator